MPHRINIGLLMTMSIVFLGIILGILVIGHFQYNSDTAIHAGNGLHHTQYFRRLSSLTAAHKEPSERKIDLSTDGFQNERYTGTQDECLQKKKQRQDDVNSKTVLLSSSGHPSAAAVHIMWRHPTLSNKTYPHLILGNFINSGVYIYLCCVYVCVLCVVFLCCFCICVWCV
jgi:hypothetical protein